MNDRAAINAICQDIMTMQMSLIREDTEKLQESLIPYFIIPALGLLGLCLVLGETGFRKYHNGKGESNEERAIRRLPWFLLSKGMGEPFIDCCAIVMVALGIYFNSNSYWANKSRCKPV